MTETPARIDVGQQMLDKAETPQDYADVLRFAEAARVYAKQANLGPHEIDKASRLAAKALLCMARAVNEGQAAGEIATGRPKSSQGMTTLGELEIHNEHLKAGRDLLEAFDTEDAIDAYQPKTNDGLVDGRAVLIKKARSILTGMDDEQGDDWYTPRWLFDQLGLTFDLDVCAPSDATMHHVPCYSFYALPTDGLIEPWQGLVWCNPPYSDPSPWARRWLEHGNGLLLTHIPANASWAVDVWQQASAAVWMQALHFERPNGQTYRPGYALQLAALGDIAVDALDRLEVPKSGSVWRRVA